MRHEIMEATYPKRRKYLCIMALSAEQAHKKPTISWVVLGGARDVGRRRHKPQADGSLQYNLGL